MIAGLRIQMGFPEMDNIHTITLYINPERQKTFIDYILGLKPERIIFNPGTENLHLKKLAKSNNIKVVHGCTLVLLSSNHY